MIPLISMNANATLEEIVIATEDAYEMLFVRSRVLERSCDDWSRPYIHWQKKPSLALRIASPFRALAKYRAMPHERLSVPCPWFWQAETCLGTNAFLKAEHETVEIACVVRRSQCEPNMSYDQQDGSFCATNNQPNWQKPMFAFLTTILRAEPLVLRLIHIPPCCMFIHKRFKHRNLP